MSIIDQQLHVVPGDRRQVERDADARELATWSGQEGWRWMSVTPE
ncbi:MULTISPECIES: hypothetical protein [unclassified Streptomyces]